MARFFAPLLAGATLRDRTLASAGAVVGILLTSVVAALALGTPIALPLLVAPMGASAVLLFAVPASPLAQPWPVIGGNIVSVLVGVAAARWVPGAPLAAGVAVGGAILAMSLLRCLHPPGGAAALTAVIGGPAVHAAGFAFAFVPVGLNALLLTATGVLFHRLSGHAYPHRPAAPSVEPASARPHPKDLDAALAALGETLDVDRADLDRLFAEVDRHALARRRAVPGR